MSLLSLTPAGATCEAWYDAYDRSTVTLDGTRITAVADKSGGTAYDLTNSDGTAARHPTYSEADGALEYRSSEHSDQYLSHGMFDPDTTEITFFFSYTSTGDAASFLTVVQDNASSYGDWGVRMSTVGSSETTGNIKYYLGRSESGSVNINNAWNTGLKRVLTFTHANATNTSRLRLVGHTSTTTTAVTQLNETVVTDEANNMEGTGEAGLLVGGRPDAGWPDSIDVNIHEIAIFNKYMTEAEAAPIEEYLLNHGPPKAPAQSPPSMGLGIKSRRG